jgi:hypothetical protein
MVAVELNRIPGFDSDFHLKSDFRLKGEPPIYEVTILFQSCADPVERARRHYRRSIVPLAEVPVLVNGVKGGLMACT